ncbi:MAG TPA: phosphoribosylanthranilate isomerase [Thermoanaerobaculia bacterium]|nr:phosphoribosylanthranilate isomerase [Thermoanaerobaculia bacterium]
MTKIKICGITRLEDARFCAGLGADFLGFIFVESSPRHITPERAREIVDQVRGPRFVGVFRDASAHYMSEVARVAGVDLLQLHGSESDDDIRAAAMPAIKAFRVGDELPDATTAADWVLFDTFDERRGGGTGRRFDWSLLASYPRTKPFFLAGGVTPENVAVAISSVRPDAIDVSSGVESEPGIKDHAKVRSLFERVRRA